MEQFVSYQEFKRKIKAEYPVAGIDEVTRDPACGYWLDRGMFRWYRLCSEIHSIPKTDGFTILDVGAFPFTALKVSKLFFPESRVAGAGLWGSEIDVNLREDPLLKDGFFVQSNLDPWIALSQRSDIPATGIDMPDGSIDFVIFTEVVEHLYNPAHALQEIARVMKPGGRLYLTTNNVSYWFHALRLLKGETNLDRELDQITVDFERTFPHDWRGHVRFYSIGQLIEILSRAGIVKIIAATTYDTTDIPPGGASLSKVLRTFVKSMTNHIPLLRKHRGHIEIIAEKTV